MESIAKYMCGADPVFMATNHLLVDLLDENSIAAGAAWWEALTESGGEGMVVKPFDFIAMKGKELLQPAVKCRGREYLRIIYGPEYALGANLERLKNGRSEKSGTLRLTNSPLGWNRWNDSPEKNRFTASTSACSGCWLWKASRWTRGCKRRRFSRAVWHVSYTF